MIPSGRGGAEGEVWEEGGEGEVERDMERGWRVLVG